MNNRKHILTVALMLSALAAGADDSVPSGFSHSLEWRIGAELSPAYIPGTNHFLTGDNPEGKLIRSTFSGGLRADFSFDPVSREGMLYRGLYQGIGVGMSTYFANSLLGTPLSVYAYQGAPIVHFSDRLWLGYEWQFGAAMGWKHFNEETAENNAVVSTSVTAHMGIGLKLNYLLSNKWEFSFGIGARHYSNGNTSWPNAGVNSLGATIGIAYIINPYSKSSISDAALEEQADRHSWFYDIMAYGAWRKRVVNIGVPIEPELCPGKFGVLGMQFSPMCKLNRYVAVGPALDLQWDESAGLDSYWIEGTSGDNIKFERPPFGKQVSAGLSVHAELTMPIFSVNAGLGYDIVSPEGAKRFYQSLTLKTFITKKMYLNVGYRLGNFSDPQNLMLGIGLRL